MRIYTKTGDAGQTGLVGGTRVNKDDPRVQCYGDIDELNAQLGLASVVAPDEPRIARLQNLLFQLGSQVATPPGRTPPCTVTEADIVAMERDIDALELALAPLKNFVLPGGTELSARLHVARTVCRRAERSSIALHDPHAVKFLNRLSDLLFVMARAANHLAGAPDVIWKG
jgi:cob(I)alamin adenosyltransferase